MSGEHAKDNKPENIEDIVDIEISPPQEEELEYDSFSEELHIDKKPPSTPKETLSADQVQTQILQDQLDRTKDQMIRALAEAENTRKRAQKEREDAKKFAISGFARDLISVADNLRRALEAIPQEEAKNHPHIQNLLGGIEATERELLRSFEKNGIQKTDPIGQPFDPNFHEVMFETPIPGTPGGTIIQVLEPGYTINGRILRPARVGIAKNESGGNQGTPPTEPGQNLNTEA